MTRAGRISHHGRATVLVFAPLLATACLATAPALAAHRQDGGGVADDSFVSRHFCLHTDLAAPEAGALLKRMEKALGLAEQHWGQPLRGKIECYVIEHLERWPNSALPHPLARIYIGGVGGATIAEPLPSSRSHREAAGRGRKKATVYACPRIGVAEHEVIHAYCFQTFGHAGPEWYMEGMAQMMTHSCVQDQGVWCPPESFEWLRAQPRPKIEHVVQANRMTGKIGRSLDAMLLRCQGNHTHVPLSDWTDREAQLVDRAREDYLWCWALCHLLAHNPNYSARFRLMGSSLLGRRDRSFQQFFGTARQELQFEYEWFLKHMELGYRVDLCRWEWDKRFQPLGQGAAVQRRIVAARGFQASRLWVQLGHRYRYRAEGAWSTSATGPLTSADGAPDGSGRLVGIVMKDFQVTGPFELGADGSFVAPCDGALYLRCRDAWGALADNRGAVVVRWNR